jgi:hypothetical protein
MPSLSIKLLLEKFIVAEPIRTFFEFLKKPNVFSAVKTI